MSISKEDARAKLRKLKEMSKELTALYRTYNIDHYCNLIDEITPLEVQILEETKFLVNHTIYYRNELIKFIATIIFPKKNANT